MSILPHAGNGKVSVPDILSRKTASSVGSPESQNKITCLTAYDYPTARLLDEAGVDIILVGDSVGMAVLGYDSTLPVTLDEMLHHVRAVRRGTQPRAARGRHAVRQLPRLDRGFGAQRHAPRERGRRGGRENRRRRAAPRTDSPAGGSRDSGDGPRRAHAAIGERDGRISRAGQIDGRGAAGGARRARRGSGGRFRRGARIDAARARGAASPQQLRIPTIGIGAGPDCDGQVLVFHDLVGLTEGYTPKFVRRYANLAAEITRAVTEYCADVRAGQFPSDAESYHSRRAARAQGEGLRF